MYKSSFICFWVSVLWIAGYTSSAESGSAPVFTVTVGEANTGLCDSLWRYSKPVFLETTSESALSMISKVVLWNGRIFVSDNRYDKICVFDTAGKFLWNIRRVGRGPGEYIGMTDFVIDPDREELIIYADKPYKLIHCGVQGDFRYESRLPDALFKELAFTEKYLVAINSQQMFPADYLSLIERGREDGFVKIPFERPIPFNTYSIGRQLVVSDHLNFTCRYDNTVYRLDGKEIVPWFQIDFGEKNFPASRLNVQLTQEEFWDLLVKGYVYSVTNVTEDGKTVYFTTNLSGLGKIDLEGRQTTYLRSLKDGRLGVFLGEMLAVEHVGGHPVVGFSQTLQQLKLSVSDRGNSTDSVFLSRVRTAREDDNPVLFFYSNHPFE